MRLRNLIGKNAALRCDRRQLSLILENSTLTITEGKGAFNLMVRYPEWVHPGEFKVSVNGQSVDVITGPSSYVSINRKWKKGML